MNCNYLQNVVVGRQISGTNVNMNVIIVKEVTSQLLNLFWPSCTPHQNLTVWTNLLENLPDLGLETHVQHPVGLIETHVGHTTKIHLSSLQEVDKSARSCNADLDTIFNVSKLGSLGCSSKDTSVFDS